MVKVKNKRVKKTPTETAIQASVIKNFKAQIDLLENNTTHDIKGDAIK